MDTAGMHVGRVCGCDQHHLADLAARERRRRAPVVEQGHQARARLVSAQASACQACQAPGLRGTFYVLPRSAGRSRALRRVCPRPWCRLSLARVQGRGGGAAAVCGAPLPHAGAGARCAPGRRAWLLRAGPRLLRMLLGLWSGRNSCRSHAVGAFYCRWQQLLRAAAGAPRS